MARFDSDRELTAAECFSGWKSEPSMRDGVGSILQGDVQLQRFIQADVAVLWWNDPSPNSATKREHLDLIESSARRDEEEPMAVILRGCPAPLDWGFFTNEDARMHLQTVSKGHRVGREKYKIWLERGGRWEFEWDSRPPRTADQRLVEHEISERRQEIEDAWISLMLSKNWLKFELQGSVLVLTVYPGRDSFQRRIDLSQEFPGAHQTITSDDLSLDSEHSAIILWRKRRPEKQQHLSLVGRLWR